MTPLVRNWLLLLTAMLLALFWIAMLLALLWRVHTDRQIAWTGRVTAAGPFLLSLERHNPDPSELFVWYQVMSEYDLMRSPNAKENKRRWQAWLGITP